MIWSGRKIEKVGSLVSKEVVCILYKMLIELPSEEKQFQTFYESCNLNRGGGS